MRPSTRYPTHLADLFAWNLRRVIHRNRVERHRLARRCGVSHNMLTNYLNCRRCPDEQTVNSIAEALDVTPDSLLSSPIPARSDQDLVIQLAERVGPRGIELVKAVEAYLNKHPGGQA